MADDPESTDRARGEPDAVRPLDDVRATDLETVGGKAASLGELTAAGFPVPPGFVVTADTYRRFVQAAGIEDRLSEALDIDPEDSRALRAAAEAARDLVTGTPLPEDLRVQVLEAYAGVGAGDEFAAVRSSATAEDLPDASFAGQQETYLNVRADTLLDRVRDCWASMYTERAIYYREDRGFDHDAVDVAVVVQAMVDADASGVMFTSHPSTGDDRVVVEAAWGLGEAVVSGAVTPDHYVYDPDAGEVTQVTVGDKRVMTVRDADAGATTTVPVPDARREQRVLGDDQLGALVRLGKRIEDHYGEPQDVEWAIADGEVYVLQSRPITTIDAGSESTEARDTSEGVADGGTAQVATADEDPDGELLVEGLAAGPGVASGTVRVVENLDQLDAVTDGDVVVTEMTTPDMVPAMKRAVAIVTDQGGMTSHAAIVSRELGVPAVVGTGSATRDLENGKAVTVDGDRGTVRAGGDTSTTEESDDAVEAVRPETPVKPMTATEVKVNVSIPEAAERAAATGADGVGLLRVEHVVLSLGATPGRYIEEHGAAAFREEIVDGVRRVAEAFYPRPVRVRTLDAPTDEFRGMDGGDEEPEEHNPMLGWRGIRRSLDEPDVFRQELGAFRELYELGYDNVEIMFPLVNDPEDALAAKAVMEEAGIDPEKRSWGVMIETPASAVMAGALAATGIDFASFGTNDLTQYTLAVDRNNGAVADRFDELHPAVLELIGDVIETCREHDVDTSICGQAGSDPRMVSHLVEAGIGSISANVDAVRDVQHEVKRVEQQVLLDSVR